MKTEDLRKIYAIMVLRIDAAAAAMKIVVMDHLAVQISVNFVNQFNHALVLMIVIALVQIHINKFLIK
jgi:hypothetical protein